MYNKEYLNIISLKMLSHASFQLEVIKLARKFFGWKMEALIMFRLLFIGHI